MASHIRATYLKHRTPASSTALPVATHLVPIYATVNDRDDQELSSSDNDELDFNIKKYSYKREGNICVVCQEIPSTRCTLPCRHACTCSRCYIRLSGRCPVCRTVIEKITRHITSYHV